MVDASAMICLLLNTPEHRADAIRDRFQDDELYAPHLIDLEVAHTLRRMARIGTLSVERGSRVLSRLAEVRMLRYPHYPFFARIWQLRSNLTAYDAAYVALAEFLNAPLITGDARMARSGAAAKIEVF